GTHALALAARTHGVPFFVAAPSSTFDPACPSGAEIPIERRDEAEVLEVEESVEGRPLRIAPRGASADNPAFDVTPFEWVTAIVTEHGTWNPR
ncbi:MAG: S-methyl-5-thioribose-1-phosphate isomerase, partial [Mariprofundaceae bacterium]